MPCILTSAPRRREGLPALPANIRDILAMSLALSYEHVDKLWSQTGDILMHEYDASKKITDPWQVDEVLSKIAPQFELGT